MWILLQFDFRELFPSRAAAAPPYPPSDALMARNLALLLPSFLSSFAKKYWASIRNGGPRPSAAAGGIMGPGPVRRSFEVWCKMGRMESGILISPLLASY